MGVTVQDYRRTDQRDHALENPFWISSGVVDGATATISDKCCLLFSFPKAGQQIVIWDIAVHIITAFTAATVMELGSYTIATDAVTTGGSATLVEADEYLPHGSITATTIGWYYAATGHWLVARAAGTHVNPANHLVGVAATVQCIALTPTISTVIIGQAQAHLLISIVPGT
jgi:hypothetical protein